MIVYTHTPHALTQMLQSIRAPILSSEVNIAVTSAPGARSSASCVPDRGHLQRERPRSQ